MNSGAVDPKYIPGRITNITSGSAIYPLPDNQFVNAVTYFSNSLDPQEDEDKALIKELKKISLGYIKWQDKEYRNSYITQKIFAIIIFSVTIAIVILGLIFSYIQFSNAVFLGNYSELSSEIVAKVGEVSLNTSVVGISILFISLLFFYFFLKFVYQIKPPSDFKPSLMNNQEIKKE